jgi:FKBP-type peptidyl-prolyl cis-trans isomerase (trigger factor)
MEDLIRNLESRSLTLQDYLAAQKQDLAQLQTELREQALQRLSTTLVLLDLARENEITVTEKDVEGEVKARAEAEDVKLSQMRRLLNDTGEIDTIRNRIFFRKITELLREKAEIREVEG